MTRFLPHCTGSCREGRATCNCPTGQTEIANTHSHLHLVRSTASRPPIQISGGRIPRARRARHFFRELWDFLRSTRFRA